MSSIKIEYQLNNSNNITLNWDGSITIRRYSIMALSDNAPPQEFTLDYSEAQVLKKLILAENIVMKNEQ